MKTKISFILYIALLISTIGCSSISYVMEAGYGQLKIFNRAQPLEKALSKPNLLKPYEKKILSEMPTIREYMNEIGLKKNVNYREYVPLDQAYVTYVVTASDPLAFKARTWSFPIVGSFNYIGFHKEKSAQKFAEELKKEDLDVSVRGARAYSTLGWFSDPILSSMLIDKDFGVGYFVNTIIHETVHVTVYVNGQSYFNESMANFFADQVTPLYLERRFGKNSNEYKSYQEYEKNGDHYRKVTHDLYHKLNNLYENKDISETQKREQKIHFIQEAQKVLKQTTEINNASLIQFKTYGVGEVEFSELYAFLDNNPVQFIQCMALIKESDFPKQHAEEFMGIIDKLIHSNCQASPRK